MPPLLFCIGPTICIGQESWCLSYAGFSCKCPSFCWFLIDVSNQERTRHSVIPCHVLDGKNKGPAWTCPGSVTWSSSSPASWRTRTRGGRKRICPETRTDLCMSHDAKTGGGYAGDQCLLSIFGMHYKKIDKQIGTSLEAFSLKASTQLPWISTKCDNNMSIIQSLSSRNSC